MKKSMKFAGVLVGALAFTSLFGLSAIAEERHQDESTWRESQRGDDRYDRNDRNDRYDRDDRYDRRGRRDDRDFLSGRVERIDYRRGVVMLRTSRSSRPVYVEMTRRNTRGGLDLGDLRRGDSVTFIGDWSRGGVFTAWRIDNIDSRGGRGRNRW